MNALCTLKVWKRLEFMKYRKQQCLPNELPKSISAIFTSPKVGLTLVDSSQWVLAPRANSDKSIKQIHLWQDIKRDHSQSKINKSSAHFILGNRHDTIWYDSHCDWNSERTVGSWCRICLAMKVSDQIDKFYVNRTDSTLEVKFFIQFSCIRKFFISNRE